MRRLFVCAVASMLAALVNAQELKLEIHPDKVQADITSLLYGAGMEDVNHEIYGGIYSQRIFGESFEEGILPEGFECLRVYDGIARMDGDALQIYSEPLAKIVATGHEFADGWAEVEVRFDGIGDYNAGLLINVSDVQNGKDAYCGYEVVLNRKGVMLNFCCNDCTTLAKSETGELYGFEWYKVRAEISGSVIAVYLDDEKVIAYDHKERQLKKGGVGVRTVNCNASFRNLRAGYMNDVYEIPLHQQTPML